MLDQMFSFEGNEMDALSIKFLSDGIGEHANAKFDYVKYRQALKGLGEKNIETDIAIQSTLTTAETMGIFPKDILDSAMNFISLLDLEQTKFDQSLQNQFLLKVKAKEDEVKRQMNEVELHKSKIEELQKQILSIEANITNEQKLIVENTTFINTKKNQFHNTVEQIKKLVNEDIFTLKNKTN